MTLGKLVRLVGGNARRNRKEFALSSFGIVVGVAAFVFFLALSMGVKNKVLELFPLERVEVVAPKVAMSVAESTRIDDSTVQAIREQSGVKTVSLVPRMGFSLPVKVSGYFEGAHLTMDFVGDGVDPAYVREDNVSDLFKDWEVENTPLQDCVLPKLTCEGLYYCDKRDMKCHHRVPVVVSSKLIASYNTLFAKSRGLPAIGAMEEFIVKRGGLSKMRLYIDLGEAAVALNQKPLLAKPRRVEGVLLGISDRAIDLGATVPIGYAKRWNKEYVGEQAASEYSSIIVELDDKEDVARFGTWLKSTLNLELKDSLGEVLASIITVITLIFVVIALIIVTISAINIAHSFFMQVSERRQEIGLLRAVGATQSDIRMMFVGEATFLGLVAGSIGVGLGIGIGLLGDWIFSRHVDDLPFKPETLFDFQWWIPLSGLALAILFAVIGGLLPANRAARTQPAAALAK